MLDLIKGKKLILLSSSLLMCVASCSAPNSNAVKLEGASISEDTKFKAANVGISIPDFEKLGFALGDSCDVLFSNGYELKDVPYYNGYYVKNGDPVIVAYPSNPCITITLNNVGIWETARLSEGYNVTVTLKEAGKYLPTQEALGQSYSLLREDYSSDEEFSNFRALKGGRLKENLVYRGASPVDNSRNRAEITDGLLKKNGVSCVIDLADSEEDFQTYAKDASYSTPYTVSLHDEGKVCLLSMGSSYTSDVYKQSVAKGFNFALSHDGPYYIHCMEGKDRTGFVCTLLEALLGASYEEMRDDYMMTYQNYYRISPDKTPEKYNAVVSLYFDSFIECLHGSAEKLGENGYVENAKCYLASGGMEASAIDAFIAKLS